MPESVYVSAYLREKAGAGGREGARNAADAMSCATGLMYLCMFTSHAMAW